ncbi:MAG: hypothetical protein ABIJ97_06795 [Bacteroidota bacterium]
MKVLNLIFAIIFLWIFPQYLLAEKKVFYEDILSNPVKNAEKLEKIFVYNEIERFRSLSISNAVILENGYARSEIVNNQDWDVNIKNRKVTRIDIVFTKYPLKKEDWITNYHKLLADRLNNLFKMDSSLNSDEIQWNLVLQTGCKTGKEAQTYYHGIIIYFEVLTEKVPYSEKILRTDEVTNVSVIHKDTSTFNNFIPQSTNEDLIYLIKIEKKRNKQKKPEPVQVPDCPTFRKKWLW